jgi:protein import protein ZIM17
MSLRSNTLQRLCLRPSAGRLPYRQPTLTQSCRNQLRNLSTPSPSPRLLRPSILNSLPQQQRRCESTARPLTDRPDQLSKPEPRDQVPSYEMTFTCKACQHRSSHRMSKQGYHHGTILITCPGCKGRHLIADHLKVSPRKEQCLHPHSLTRIYTHQIFSDKAITLEDILAQKGQLLKKGALDSESDIEFWDDGTQTERVKKP